MNKKAAKPAAIMCAVTLLSVLPAFAAGTVTVGEGETFEMTSESGSDVEVDFNVYASRIDCSGNCTVKILNDGGEVKPRFWLDDGANLTIDMTLRTSDVLFSGGFIAGEGASITIKGGPGTIRFGRGGTGYGSYAVMDADDISFTDASGNAIDGTVVFNTASLWKRVPDSDSVGFAFGSGARIYAHGEGVLDRFTNEVGDVVFSGFQIVDTGNGAIPPTARLRVGEDGTFSLFHCSVGSDYGSIAPSPDWTFANDVVLEDSSATFSLMSQYGGDFTGSVSGEGSVVIEPYSGFGFNWDEGEKDRVTFTKMLEISGALRLTRTRGRLQLVSGSTVGEFLCVGTACVFVEGESEFTVTGKSDSGRISVSGGGTLTLSAGTGYITVTGESKFSSALSLTALPDGGRVRYSKIAASSSVPGVKEMFTGTGGMFYCGANDLAELDSGVSGVKTLVFSGTDNEVTSLSPDCEIRLADSGSSVSIAADNVNSLSVHPNGGTVTIEAFNDITNILDRAMLWCDASVEGSWTQYVHGDADPMTYTVEYGSLKGNVYPVVNHWNDVRGNTEYGLVRVPYSNAANYISPHRVTGQWNGPYMSLDTRKSGGGARACRLGLTKNGYTDNDVSAALVLMVFEPAPGGGKSVLGNKDGAFARKSAAITSPILPENCTGCSVWINGEAKADPTNCFFESGWQILTIDPGEYTLNGLALPSDTNMDAAGGMNVAEILIFDEDLSDTERMRVERYLADKWGLAGSYKGAEYVPSVSARAYGTGNITLAADTGLGGLYSGTIDLGGHELTVPASAAPGEDEVAAIPGRTGWFDPSSPESLDFWVAMATDRSVKYLNDRVLGDSDGAWTIYGSSLQRAAYLREDGWLDLRRGSSGADNATYPDGALIRFNRWPDSVETTDLSAMPVRTVVMAQDSSAGGGTPLSTAVFTKSSALGRRIEVTDGSSSHTVDDHSSPIWPASVGNAYSGAAVYLDGVAVDATARGFNGRKEVFSSVFGTDLPLAVFGDYGRNICTNSLGEEQGEILGEMLMFSRELEDSERNLVEAYLMRKWCGTVMPGYGDLTAATVTGNGTVNVPSPAAAPRFDSGFTGTVAVETGTFAFTVDASKRTDAAVNALIAANGTLSLPASVTVTVDVVPPAVIGTYTLISAKTVSGPTDWTLSVTSGLTGGKVALFRRTDSGVVLDIVPRGTVITVR